MDKLLLIKDEARKVRKYLQTEAPNLSFLFEYFPNGACGNASDILGFWLRKSGISSVEYIHGVRNGASHGWLIIQDIIIDITSDQFEDGLGSVYVGKINDFHSSFEDQKHGILTIASETAHVYSKMVESFKSNM